MINLNNLSLSFSGRPLFSGVTVSIKSNSKVGLVGKNGAGKSSLFKLITGEFSATEGSIDIPKNASLGYLSQFLTLDESLTVMEAAKLAFDEINQLDKQLDDCNAELGQREDYESDDYQKLIDKISFIAQKLDFLGADKVEAKTEKVLKGLGFSESQLDMKIAELSGGWKMRVELAKLLLEQPDYLLLDEPINHLDIESILWLEDWLRNYPGAFVIIAHDSEFMDNCVKEIFEITNNKIELYKCNYSKYLVEKDIRHTQLAATFKNQQKQIAQKERLVERFRAKASKAAMAKSIQKELDRMDKIEFQEEKGHKVRFQFLPSVRANQIVCEATSVSKSYDEKEVLSNIDFQIERGQKIAFVGQNGQGKSTLAKLLIEKIKPSSGLIHLGDNIQLAYFAQDAADQLPRDKTLLEFLEGEANDEMRPKVRALLGAFLFSGEDVEKKISVLSGGEKNRLAFARLLLEPFNFLVLDEPTHHLDIQSKNTLKEALQQFDGSLLIISHDRGFLEGLTEQVIEFRDRQIIQYLGDIQYFLSKRQAESMREIEKKNKPKSSPAAKEAQTIPYETQKRITRLESGISKLESKIKQMEKSMGSEGFYEQSDAQEIIDQYNKLKSELDEKISSWEELLESLES